MRQGRVEAESARGNRHYHHHHGAGDQGARLKKCPTFPLDNIPTIWYA